MGILTLTPLSGQFVVEFIRQGGLDKLWATNGNSNEIMQITGVVASPGLGLHEIIADRERDGWQFFGESDAVRLVFAGGMTIQ